MKIKKFDWGKFEKEDKRFPTDEEATMLVKMFEECSWNLIRDILVDSGLTDESFPRFWCDFMPGNKKLRANTNAFGQNIKQRKIEALLEEVEKNIKKLRDENQRKI